MIGKTEASNFLSVYITSVAGYWCRTDFRGDTNLLANNRLGSTFSESRRSQTRKSNYPDAVRTNNEVGDDRSTVRESDGAGVIIDALTAGMKVIALIHVGGIWSHL